MSDPSGSSPSRPIVTARELRDRLLDGDVVLVDARTGPDARLRYRAAHLPGARFVDLDADLARRGDDAALGGRHPLPPIGDFARLIGQLGIAPATPVVVYDEASGANAASRLWWMLRSAGHGAVQVLDGGLAAALDAGIGTEAGDVRPASVAPYPAREWTLPTASMADVERASRDGSAPIIDVREARRYRGEIEPIDTVAGHIPRAMNIPFATNLDASGHYLAPDALRAKYAAALGDHRPDDAIVHCGSGVTACHTLLAFAQAGLPIPRLYVGSWSEWSRNPNPVATGE